MAQKLSVRQKLAYGVGDTSFSLVYTITAAYFAIFLTDVVKVSPGIAAIAIFIGRTWDYINDPLVGYISDRTRTRWGRRRPFLIFGALPFALSFMLLWVRPGWDNEIALAVYYAVVYVLFDTAATFCLMPYCALTPELTEDYDERTSLTSFRMFFSIAASLIAFTIPLLIVEEFKPENAGRVLLMGGIFGALAMIPLFITFFGTKERKDFMEQKPSSLKQSLKAAARNRPFIFGAVIFLLTWVCMDIMQTNLLYYVKHVVNQGPNSDMIMATIFVVACLVLPFWVWVSKHWNKRYAYVAGIAVWGVVQLGLSSLDASASLELILILCAVGGIGVSSAHVLPWAIVPDAIEWDEYHTGERHEGMFYSLITLVQKIASSIAIPLTLLVLEATGYNADLAQQPASAVNGIRFIVGPVPAVLLALGILFALLYPLSREQHRKVVEELAARRAAAGGKQ
jgi:GPH family glycoside/pentoside/hexuronide:cation symporter